MAEVTEVVSEVLAVLSVEAAGEALSLFTDPVEETAGDADLDVGVRKPLLSSLVSSFLMDSYGLKEDLSSL